MRITIAQGAFLPVPPLRGGAIEKIWFALGQEFVRRGHSVTHLSRTDPRLPAREVIAGVEHLRLPGFDAPRSLTVLKLLDLIYSRRVAARLPEADILVTNTFWLPILVRSPKFGKLYVHVARYPRGQMRFYRHAARLQTVSHPIEEAIVNEYPMLKDRVRTIGNPMTFAEAETQLAETPREKEILYVGRIHPEKGLDLLIRAFRQVADSLPGWRLVIVGPSELNAGGGGEDYLKELKTAAGPLGHRVDWVGPCYDSSRLASYYGRASLFVYPSLADFGETFGVAPLEAMAFACPALVSSIACFQDFIVPEKNGFVFDHHAADPTGALAAKLLFLLSDPQRLIAVGEEARSKACDFTVGKIAQDYLNDFERVAHPSNLVS